MVAEKEEQDSSMIDYCPECKSHFNPELMTKITIPKPKGRPNIVRKMCRFCKEKIISRRKQIERASHNH